MKKQVQKVIEERKKALLALFKKGGTDVHLIERELALLAIDVVLALQNKESANAGSRHFREIEFAMSGTVRKKLSAETRELLNEMLILDELGDKYGPNLTLVFDTAQKIIGGQGRRMLAGMKPERVAVA